MANTIADNLQRLVDATDAIGQAIIDAGGTVQDGDRLEEYPADIATIATNIGTKTITDDSTIKFVGDGNPLLKYTIKGNMAQNGTPSPTNIIYPDECGERTEAPAESNWKIPVDINDSTVDVYLGEVQSTRRIKKIVLNGNENWQPLWGAWSLGLIPSDAFTSSEATTVVCSHYDARKNCPKSAGLPTAYGDKIICFRDHLSQLLIKDTSYSSVTDFQTHLAQQYNNGTPVTVWYVLAEQTTGIVDEPLRKIGDYVDIVTGPPIAIPTVEGTNTLKFDTSLNPSETFIKYRYIENVALLGEKTITSDGVYSAADDNLDGYSSMTVVVTPPINAIIEPADDTLERALGDGIAPPTPVPPTVPEGTVRFIDYDGSVIHEYSSRVFLGSTSLPSNPTHEGLTAQGWNWSLADAKAYVTTYGSLNIGQMYTTDDGNTRLHIRLGEGRLKPYLGLTGNSSGTTISINWGDDSVAESVTLNTSTVHTPHEYSIEGDYTISITVTNGSITLDSDDNYSSNILRKSTSSNGHNDKVYKNSLVSLEIGNNVTGIDNDVFSDYYSLSFITIPNTVTSIGDYAFLNCYSLQSITIPNSVTSIGSNAFQNCSSLTSITIPNGVTSIGSSSFDGCSSLLSATIPNTTTNIGGNTFQNCSSLQSIIISNNVTSIGSNTFQNCSSLQSITIPDDVTIISSSAFYNCYSLTSVTISDGVTSIGNDVFSGCYSLTSITIPDTVTSIGQGAFYNCYSLTSVTISDSITSINDGTFQNCSSLQSITIPDGVTSIGIIAFKNCFALTSVTIPDTVTSIDVGAFQSCYSLLSVTIPSSVTSIGLDAFRGCSSLTSIAIPDSVTSIGSSTFYNCYSLSSITIPDSVTSISSNAFYQCYSLQSITIPDTITSIGSSTFYNCYSLQSITIPDSVTSIGNYAFEYCFGLGSIKFTSTTPPTVSNSDTWYKVPTDCIIYVPTGTLSAYKTATNYPSSSTYTYVEY